MTHDVIVAGSGSVGGVTAGVPTQTETKVEVPGRPSPRTEVADGARHGASAYEPATSRMLGRRLRKVVLTVHVISAVGWIGAACAYLSLTVAALTSESDDTVRAAFIAMELVYFTLIPLAATALATGIAQALGTNWGLLRHYWVVAKLLLTLVAFGVMVNNLGEVSSHADHVRHAPGADLPGGAATHGLGHAGVGVLILLVVATLGLYKPRGLTRYGRRKQDRLRAKREEPRPDP